MKKEKFEKGHKVLRTNNFRKSLKTVLAVTVIAILGSTILMLSPPIESEKSWEYEVDENTIGLWHLNEGTGTTANDETDNNNDWTLKNGVNWTMDSRFGNHALEFDRENDYIKSRDRVWENEGTIEVRIRPNINYCRNNKSTFLDKCHSVAAGFISNGKILFSMRYGGSTHYNDSTINLYKEEIWYNIAFSWSNSGNECVYYIECYTVDNMGNNEITHNQTFYVDETPPISSKIYVNECIHYIELYAIDNVENIETTHNQTFYIDETPPTISTVWGNECTHYIEFYAEDEVVGIDYILYHIWYDGLDVSNIRILYATSTDGKNGSNCQIVLDYNIEGTYDKTHVHNPSVIKNGKWYHIAGVRDVDTLKIYIDSVLENQVDCSTVGSLDNLNPLRISQYGTTNCFFNGIMDEIRYSNISKTIFKIPPTLKFELEKTLLPGENTYKLTIKIQNDGETGTYSCQGQLLTALPKNGGYCLGFADDTFEDYNQIYLSFSSDDKSIVYASYEDGGGIDDIRIMDSDGGNHIQLTFENYRQAMPYFSKDGLKIVYESSEASGCNLDIWIIDLNRSNLGNNFMKEKEHISSEDKYLQEYKSMNKIFIISFVFRG